jgi:hypothetical protein
VAAHTSTVNATFKFIVPSVDAKGNPVSDSKRNRYIKAIEGRSTAVNGGFTRYESCKGGYWSNSSTLVLENVVVIETVGQNPFSEEELVGFTRELDQECLFVEVAGWCWSFPSDTDRRQEVSLCREAIESKEIVTIAREEVTKGAYRFVQKLFDAKWNPIFFSVLSDTEVHQMICEGDRVIKKVVNDTTH